MRNCRHRSIKLSFSFRSNFPIFDDRAILPELPFMSFHFLCYEATRGDASRCDTCYTELPEEEANEKRQERCEGKIKQKKLRASRKDEGKN